MLDRNNGGVHIQMTKTEISVFFGDQRESRVSYDTMTESYKVLMIDYEKNLHREHTYSHRQLAEDAAEDWCL
jgi:hypothetical protein